LEDLSEFLTENAILSLPIKVRLFQPEFTNPPGFTTHFAMFFAFWCGESPNKKMMKAYRLIDSCEDYIFSSKDETELFLEESLQRIARIAPTLEQTEGNSSSTSDDFSDAAEFHSVIRNAIRWVQANRGLSPEEVKVKYPTLIDDCLAEDKRDSEWIYNCRLNWVCEQVDREVPNLLSPYIHRGRLGKVIDEVLGLGGRASPTERSEQASARAQHIAGDSPQS
jgi:hypothetical protein